MWHLSRADVTEFFTIKKMKLEQHTSNAGIYLKTQAKTKLNKNKSKQIGLWPFLMVSTVSTNLKSNRKELQSLGHAI